MLWILYTQDPVLYEPVYPFIKIRRYEQNVKTWLNEKVKVPGGC